MKFITHSIRFRVALIATMLLGLILMTFTGVLYREFTQSQQVSFDASLYNHTVEVAQALSIDPIGQLQLDASVLQERKKLLPFELRQSIIQIVRTDGQRVASSSPPIPLSPGKEEITRILRSTRPSLSFAKAGGRNLRVVSFPLASISPPLILQVAAPLVALEQSKNALRASIFFILPFALLTMAVVCFATIHQALKPVRRITQRASLIRPDSLSSRIPMPEENELRDLGQTLNSMLMRIERAFRSQEQFTADASHQLKTPLAIMKNDLESLLRSSTRGSSLDKSLLEEIVSEVDGLAKTVDQLLVLAKFDSELSDLNLQIVRLDEILLESMNEMQKLAQNKDIEIDFEIEEGPQLEANDLEVKGNFDLLKTLFTNIIDNAIKYSPHDTKVKITLRPGVIPKVMITDSGEGIGLENRERIFDRFFRSARDLTSPGVGLGLAIVKKIASIHGAEVRVDSGTNGSTFTILFARSSQPLVTG